MMSLLLLWLHHPIARTVGMILLHFLWQGTALALAAALLLWLLKGSSSRLRYAVACAVMLLMAALPPITFHQLWIRPIPVASEKLIKAAPLVPSKRSTTPAPVMDSWMQTQRPLERILPFVLMGWLVGVMILSSRLMGGWAWLQWLRRRRDTVPATDEQQLLLLRLCQHMKLVSNIRLLRCDRVEGPTVLGWLKPVVLIPGAALTGLSPAQLELVLAHELAHILRHDYAINLIQSVIEVLLFYHPAVWWLSARIRQERELCCDDLAVRLAGDALDYAQALTRLEHLRLMRDRSGPSSQPVLSMSAHGGSFMHRIQRLISPTISTPLAPRAGILTLMFLALAVTLGAKNWSQDPQITAQQTERYFLLRRYNEPSPDGKMKAGQYYIETRGILMEQALMALHQFETIKTSGPTTELRVPFTESEETRGINGGLTGTSDSIEGIRQWIMDSQLGQSWKGFMMVSSSDGQAARMVMSPEYPGQAIAQGKAAILRRYNHDSPDGKVKTGMVSLEGSAKPQDVVDALEMQKQIPSDGPVTETPILYTSSGEANSKGSRFTFNLPPQPVEHLRAILLSMPARKSLDHQPSLVVIRRWNTPTLDMRTSLQGLHVDAVAEDVEADTIREVLEELEAMNPSPGIVQEVRREAGHGKAQKMSLDLQGADPDVLHRLLDQEIQKAKP